ncbi:MAG: ABC transporter substrate-binding protein [Alphaproteobacteria bacterium]
MDTSENKKSSSLKTASLAKRLLIGLLVVLGSGYLLQQLSPQLRGLSLPLPKQSFTQTVAITQIVPHPSLDMIRRGIVDVLREGGIEEEQILFENAMGNVATATQIAHKFVSLKPSVIVPITTPSTQSAYAAAKDAGIPVIFAAVSDPVAAKLVPSMQQAGEGITGVSDLSPISDQVNLIKGILPKAATVGVVFNPGESNSVVLVALLDKACAAQGIRLIRSAASSTTDVVAATRALVGHVDAIYIPNDNTVVSALMSLLQIAEEHKIPVFSADPESVGRGCLASISHNQYQLGRQTGEMVLTYLKGTPLKELPPAYGAKTELVLNKQVAKTLGVTIPEEIKQKAVNSTKDSNSKNVVGIVQLIEHPALDQTRAGIIDALKKEGIDEGVQWQSAQGNPALALQIAQFYIGQKVQVLVTIPTTATQMALTAAKGSSIPIVFASVTDPVGAKFLSAGHPITGVSNFVETTLQVELFKKILKKEQPRLGVIYNAGEANSVILVEQMKAIKGVTWIFVTASKTSEVAQAAENLVSQVDAIFINNDNTALAAFDSIVTVATRKKVPVFCSDVDTVDKGAVAAMGANQYELGLQAGEMIVRLLNGDNVKDIAVATPRKIEIRLNQKMAATIGLSFPEDVLLRRVADVS